jgi:hypothetical protein
MSTTNNFNKQFPSDIMNDLNASKNRNIEFKQSFNNNRGWTFLLPNGLYQDHQNITNMESNLNEIFLYSGYSNFIAPENYITIKFDIKQQIYTFQRNTTILFSSSNWSNVKEFAQDYILHH